MSNLTHIEKQKLERELGMGGGYVLNFSNRTFEEFFHEVVGVKIYDEAFNEGSGSKANRMRAFWRLGSDEQLIKTLNGLIEGWDVYCGSPISDPTKTLIRQIVTRLGGQRTNSTQPRSERSSPLDEKTSGILTARLLEVTTLDPLRRGFEFEKFLNELFTAYGLSARPSFRLVGEQIDGSFDMHNETYLLEARWRGAQAAVADLHVFEGKLREKAVWSRGLFISQSGFSADGLEAFGRGKRVVCMDGFDLSEMLRLRLSFVDVLTAKVRKAAETGRPYISVRELFA